MYLTRGRTKHLLFLLPILILFVTLLSFKRPAKLGSRTIEIPRLHIHKHIQIAHSACKGTLYPELCVSTLVSLPDLASKSLPEFISATLNKTMDEVRASSANCNAIRNKMKLGPLEKAALKDCIELFDDTIAELKSAISDLAPRKSTSKHYHDLQTLLSGAMTNQYTCLDGFARSKGKVRKAIKKGLYNISHHVSNSLAMLKKIPGVNTSKSEVFPEYGNVKHGFPSWLSSTDRNLLQASANSTKFDLIVAKDGTGNFTTISEAVRAAPNSSDTRFVIYIKAGAYFENVEVERKKKMLVFIGDGIGKTVVKANRSVVDGWTTFRSATVGQRSGKLPSSQRMTWRRDSGLTDGSTVHVDLVGGYYDAGDNVKFGFPMAFTTTMLSLSVLEFGGLMRGELQNAREAIRWATDYLLKVTAHTDTIYVQVGDAIKDHACWERPEDMDTPRSVFKVDKNSPGSDVAAETAAALAAASLVFRRCDPTYAKLLVRRAIRVFQFADKYRGAYSNGLKRFVCPFYCSYSGYEDELLWGAAWLHKATKNPTYLNYIQVNGQTLGAAQFDSTFGWDNKHVGARILLSKAFLVQKLQSLHDYKGDADNFICSLIPGAPFSSAQYTPGGLLFKMSDSNMQYVTSTSFLLLTYAKYLTSARTVVNCGGAVVTPKRLRTIAKKQVDYLLGDNPLKMSYMVGYGPRYPQRIHHRGSSLPSIATHPRKIQCTSGFSVMNSQSPNPNVLVGAMVGGPDEHDRFPDERSDYEQSEPATYINAPLVGALAYLAHSSGQLEVLAASPIY